MPSSAQVHARSKSQRLRKTKVGQAVGGMVSSARFPLDSPMARPPCRHKGCGAPSTEGETFRIKTPPGTRYKTKLVTFWRCDRHEHSHWRQIGFKPGAKGNRR